MQKVAYWLFLLFVHCEQLYWCPFIVGIMIRLRRSFRTSPHLTGVHKIAYTSRKVGIWYVMMFKKFIFFLQCSQFHVARGFLFGKLLSLLAECCILVASEVLIYVYCELLYWRSFMVGWNYDPFAEIGTHYLTGVHKIAYVCLSKSGYNMIRYDV